MNEDPFAAAAESARRLGAALGRERHEVAVVLGSGWAAAADALGATVAEVAVSELGGFPAPTVLGHGGTVRSVDAGAGHVLVFLGRVHAYEGHPIATVVHGVRTAIAAGCRLIVLTNAAGGVNVDYRVGQPVLISDHLNLTGRSPMTGPPPPVGSRFVDLTDLYNAALRARVRDAVPGLTEGVYAGLPGPHFETPAEIRMFRMLGADLVGMSTVHEAIAARHLGAEVLGISLVTNAAAGSGQGPVDHLEVMAAGDAAAPAMGRLLRTVVECHAAA